MEEYINQINFCYTEKNQLLDIIKLRMQLSQNIFIYESN